VLAAAVAIAMAASPATSILFDGAQFRVSGWEAPAHAPAAGWGSIFTVYAGAGKVPPLAGSYAVERGELVFHPSYPIAPGVHYRAVFRASASGAAPGKTIEKTFDGLPAPTNRIARVERVYPSGDVWPANQLRLYIYFSAAMSREGAASYIHVLDDQGRELRGANAVFLPGEELWDPAFRRLTMTFDPGRIKRGLTSNENIGPPLTEGRRYTLVIDSAWPDARGVPMVEPFRKVIRGGPALRTPPDPKQWRVIAPKAGTRDDVAVDFPTPMNYPLALRVLRIAGAHGPVEGTIHVERTETQWRFTPREPWSAGAYSVVAETGLEDLAGNSIGRPFDIDVFNHVTEHIEAKTVSIPFNIH
jgi:hypothetical protein